MAKRISLAAACMLALSTLAAPAQTGLTSTAQQKSLFCDLCKIQGCSCNDDGDACTGCGSGNLTSATGRTDAQKINLEATTKMCSQAKGRLSSGKCTFN